MTKISILADSFGPNSLNIDFWPHTCQVDIPSVRQKSRPHRWCTAGAMSPRAELGRGRCCGGRRYISSAFWPAQVPAVLGNECESNPMAESGSTATGKLATSPFRQDVLGRLDAAADDAELSGKVSGEYAEANGDHNHDDACDQSIFERCDATAVGKESQQGLSMLDHLHFPFC